VPVSFFPAIPPSVPVEDEGLLRVEAEEDLENSRVHVVHRGETAVPWRGGNSRVSQGNKPEHRVHRGPPLLFPEGCVVYVKIHRGLVVLQYYLIVKTT
jgi:hypothetical protein